MSDKPKIDEISGVETTGHSWDGIEELNTPLPKWWVWTFVVSVIWSLGYVILMPAWPFPGANGWEYTKGLLGYSQRVKVTDQIAANEAALNVYRDQIAAQPIEAVQNNDELFQVALASGKSLFGDNCAPCHGSGAQGALGFPNLNDDDWLWGGTLEDIQVTISHGIRWDDDDETRINDMPAFIKDEILTPEEGSAVVEFVLQISDQNHDAAKAAAGATVFADQCAMCHGEGGEGMTMMGAPDLTDAIWLYGGDRDTIMESITNGRRGQMPAWSGRLTEGDIKELAIYVHSLGGGE
ncbi:MAG: cytochrome-c oxidase, cbb3-type subunit III [Alphaproteobacteria bacterium]|nr:MAG: cytochrome-c oxidase, cbb3-type subunit III [Alphaproteobacteria bacterium]